MIEVTFGCLHVYGDLETVRAAVVSAYAAANCGRLDYSNDDIDALVWAHAELGFTGFPEPTINEDPALGDDQVFVVPDYVDGLIAVMSWHWELAPPLRHPLAMALARQFDVISVSSIVGQYHEVTLYSGGEPAATALAGPKPPALPDAPILDMDWFEKHGTLGTPEELQEALQDPERFGVLSGCERQGLVQAFEDAPLADYDAADYLVFLRDASRLTETMKRYDPDAD